MTRLYRDTVTRRRTATPGTIRATALVVISEVIGASVRDEVTRMVEEVIIIEDIIIEDIEDIIEEDFRL